MTRSNPRDGMRVTEAGPGRRGTAVCGLVLAAATSACVGSGGSSSPDEPPEGLTITIQTFPEEPPYGSHPATSALVAFQDGDGPWQKLQGTNGTYSARVTGQRYAVAVVCQVIFGSASSARVNLSYLSVSDTTHVKVSGCIDTRPTVHVSAQLQGVPSDQQGEVYFGGALASQSTTGGPPGADRIVGAGPRGDARRGSFGG